MKCRAARKKLNGSFLPVDNRDEEVLKEHLENCPACSAEAERSRRLHRLLVSASVDDTSNLKSPETHRSEIAASLVRRTERFPRPVVQYALVTVTAVALIVGIFLAPGRTGRVIGYDLSVEGVNVDLAGDSELICEALFALGAVNAGVDVGVCDTSCRVVIFDLRNRDEAKLVEAAMRKLNPGGITVDVIPVRRHSTKI
jgi:predicted anti-sigma-YlaC factor YlaD